MDDSMDSNSIESDINEMNDTSFESVTKCDPLNTLKTELFECLASLQSAGSFALSEHLPNPVNPGLYVKGVGAVGLPLSDRDATAIKLVFGKQRKGDPFELKSGCFETKNPAWQTFIGGIIPKIMLTLGIEHEGGTIGFELCAMRMYDKDSKHNLIQHNSKKAPDILGDLAICLPSKHEGGEITISHLGQSKVYETAPYSEYDSSLIAWYSGVALNKEYIKSGQQIVLFYTLRYIGRATGSAERAIEGNAKLSSLLASWKTDYNQDMGPEVLAYRLDHKVTAALCSNALEGYDRQIVKYLQEACVLNGYHLYLAKLERQVNGSTESYDDYDDWRCDDEEHREILEEKSVTIKLSKVAGLDGVVIAQNIKITEDEIIQDDLFEREPDKEDHGFGCDTSTHYYWETAAIIMPGEARVLFFLDTDRNLTLSQWERMENMKMWLTALSNVLIIDPSNGMAAGDLIQACRIAISTMNNFSRKPQHMHYHDMPNSTEIVELLCKTIIKLARAPFLDRARNLFLDLLRSDFSQMLETSISSLSAFSTIGRGIVVFGLQPSASILRDSVSRVRSLHHRCSILEALAAGYRFAKCGSPLETVNSSKPGAGTTNGEEREDPGFSVWVNSGYKEALAQCDIGQDEDVTCLTKITALFGAEFLLNNITTALGKHMRASGELMMAFMIKLVKTTDESGSPPAAAVEAFRDMLPEMIQSMNLQVVQCNGYKRQKTGSGWYHGTTYSRESDLVERLTKLSQSIADILCQCVTLGLTSESDQIISKLLAQIHSMPAEHIDLVVQVFLKKVLTHISEQEASLTHPPFQLLFQHSLAIYVDRFVKPEPAKPTNWTRPTRGCGCVHCKDLNVFLRSPVAQEFRCNSGIKPRAHLEAVLFQDHGDYRFVTNKQRSPHTLIITKTTFIGYYTREHDAWNQRTRMAVATMTDLGAEPLKKLLGQQFTATMGLTRVRLGYHNQAARPLNHMAEMPADEIEVITID